MKKTSKKMPHSPLKWEKSLIIKKKNKKDNIAKKRTEGYCNQHKVDKGLQRRQKSINR